MRWVKMAAAAVLVCGVGIALALFLPGAFGEKTDAWFRTDEDYQRLGYHWLSCLPVDGDDELGHGTACLGLACKEGSVALATLQFPFLHEHGLRLQFRDGEEMLIFEKDEQATADTGWLLARAKISDGALDKLQGLDNLPISNNGAEPIFSMRNYAVALSDIRSRCH